MHWIIDKIPDLSLLNTAKWRLFLPQLYRQYPNDDMDLNVSITSPPVITVAQNKIDGEIYSDVTIDVLDAGNTIPVACISLVSLIEVPIRVLRAINESRILPSFTHLFFLS